MTGSSNGALAPNTAIEVCEQALRELMVLELSRKHGSEWLAAIATEPQIAKWREKLEAEKAKRQKRGVAVVPTQELAYSEFYELLEILDQDWPTFAPALGRKRETLALLERMDDLRNTVAHNRPLLSFERDLLSGIAGEIRNKVAIYMTGTDEDGQHWPRIEYLVDDVGNDLLGGNAPPGPLRPGQVVRLDGRGSDPQGRELEWEVAPHPGGVIDSARGDDVTLTWRVGDEHVAERREINVRMRAVGAKYHAVITGWDQHVWLSYRVLPPLPGTTPLA